jgi:hypothetical protein
MVPHRSGTAAGGGPDPESAAFKDADTACHPELAEVEKGMPGGGKP